MRALKAYLTHRKALTTKLPYRNRRIRFLILLLLSFIVFANMYSFNNPQALQQTIMQELQITETQFNMLYTVIALPNLVFPFFIGIVIDFMGIRIALVTLSLSVIIFQIVIAVGAINKSYQTMIIGRVLFGIAIESLNVAQTCFISYWFLGKELAFSLGLATTFPQLGNALNSYITPLIYDRTKNLAYPFFVSVGFCAVSFVCGCLAAYIDRRADRSDQERNIKTQTESQYGNQPHHQAQHINLQHIKQLKYSFWLIVALCMFAIAQYIPFLDNVNQLLQVRFCFSQLSAGKNIMITYLVTSLFGIPLGMIVDRVGYKRYLIVLGMGFFMVAHVVIYVFPQCVDSGVFQTWTGASWGLILLGFAYCFYANCLLPSIPIVVSRKFTGSAFGIMIVLENLAMAVCPIIAGQLIENAQTKQLGYKSSSLFYSIIGLLGFFLSFGLFFINKNQKIKLDGTSKAKKLRTVQILPYLDYIQESNQNNLRKKLISQQTIKQLKVMQFQPYQKPNG